MTAPVGVATAQCIGNSQRGRLALALSRQDIGGMGISCGAMTGILVGTTLSLPVPAHDRLRSALLPFPAVMSGHDRTLLPRFCGEGSPEWQWGRLWPLTSQTQNVEAVAFKRTGVFRANTRSCVLVPRFLPLRYEGAGPMRSRRAKYTGSVCEAAAAPAFASHMKPGASLRAITSCGTSTLNRPSRSVQDTTSGGVSQPLRACTVARPRLLPGRRAGGIGSPAPVQSHLGAPPSAMLANRHVPFTSRAVLVRAVRGFAIRQVPSVSRASKGKKASLSKPRRPLRGLEP